MVRYLSITNDNTIDVIVDVVDKRKEITLPANESKKTGDIRRSPSPVRESGKFGSKVLVTIMKLERDIRA